MKSKATFAHNENKYMTAESGNALIIASPDSIGNLGQMAADLIIENCQTCPTAVKLIKSRHLVPMTGMHKGSLRGPMELYSLRPGFELLQIRSQPIPVHNSQNEGHDFAQELWMSLISTGRYATVIVLCGLSAIHYCSPKPSASGEIFDSQNMEQLPADSEALIGSGSVVRRLLQVASASSSSTKLRIVGKYITEGDNIQDARSLFQYLVSDNVSTISVADAVRLPDEWQYVYGESSALKYYF